jgi:hypothetical protein
MSQRKVAPPAKKNEPKTFNPDDYTSPTLLRE